MKRDPRPAIERGAGAFLAGDTVAGGGLLSEVSFASGQTAGRARRDIGLRRRSPSRPPFDRAAAVKPIGGLEHYKEHPV